MNMAKSRDVPGKIAFTKGDLEWILTRVTVKIVSSNVIIYAS